MTIIFTELGKKAVDISQYNGKVNFQKLATTGAQICIIRSSYGITTDTRFKANWVGCKGVMVRAAYHYLDYYSNHTQGWNGYGLSDEEWGKRQAEATWALIKEDNDDAITFLDVEKASFAPDITTVTARVLAIARAYLERLDELSGKKNGVYCSLSKLTWFSTWFKDRPLWVAWYADRTPAQVTQEVTARGWKNLLLWQFTSSGDVNGDGAADGYYYGTELSGLDLNTWMSTDAQFKAFGRLPETGQALYQMKCIVGGLRIRKGPGTTYEQIGYAQYETIYDVYEVSGNWVRISALGWVCTREEEKVYMQKVGEAPAPAPVEPSDAEKLALVWAWYLRST